MPTEENVDVVVVGGGPSGSTLASLVAMQGHSVVLLEKEKFPRYQIGESLVPATIHGVCGLLGVTEELHAAGFPRKHGGTFRWGSNSEPWSFVFSLSPVMTGPTSHAYQVERMKFDDILLRRSREVGVDVREECSVAEVLADGDRVSGVVYTDKDGERHTVRATYVADASGNKSRIHSATGGERVYSEFFQNVAMFGYFAGGERLPEPRTGNIFCEAFSDGWFWYIPLREDLTSVGAVVSREAVAAMQGDQDAALKALIDKAPRLRKMLSNATRVTEGPYGEIRVRKDYSYLNTRFWRKGMVLVGDAACFIDPVFSSGVHLATYSALLAARSINSALAGIVPEDRSFAEFDARYRREYGVFYEFLVSFYDTNSNEDSYFWQAKKVSNASNSELEAFVELVGGVSSGESVFADPESTRVRFKETARVIGHSVDDVADSGGEDPTSFYQSEVIGDLMQQSLRVQEEVRFGTDVDDEEPLFAGGLVAAPDGMRWVVPED
jgi:halogenation protein CepH